MTPPNPHRYEHDALREVDLLVRPAVVRTRPILECLDTAFSLCDDLTGLLLASSRPHATLLGLGLLAYQHRAVSDYSWEFQASRWCWPASYTPTVHCQVRPCYFEAEVYLVGKLLASDDALFCLRGYRSAGACSRGVATVQLALSTLKTAPWKQAVELLARSFGHGVHLGEWPLRKESRGLCALTLSIDLRMLSLPVPPQLLNRMGSHGLRRLWTL